jgi:serine/threonine protein kinase
MIWRLVNNGTIGSGYDWNCCERCGPPPVPEGYVTKIMKEKDAKREIDNATKLGLHRFRDFVIYPEYLCEGEKGWYLYSRYGGKDLIEDFDFFDRRTSFTDDDKKRRDLIVHKLEELSKDVKKMNEAGVYHNDISFDNILFDGEKMYLIDFERAKTISTGDDQETLEVMIQDMKSPEPIVRKPAKVTLGFPVKKARRKTRKLKRTVRNHHSTIRNRRSRIIHRRVNT